MTRLGLLVALLAASIHPALAGGFTPAFDRAPINGIIAPSEYCDYDKSRQMLRSAQMTFIADVPRTDDAYRFIVQWKGDTWGASVHTANCHIDVVPKIEKQRPWCAYLPGIVLRCPLQNAQ